MKVFLLDKHLNGSYDKKDSYLSENLINNNEEIRYLSINNPVNSNKIYIMNSLDIQSNGGIKDLTLAISNENIGGFLGGLNKELVLNYGGTKNSSDRNELIVCNLDSKDYQLPHFMRNKNIMILPGGSVIINFKDNMELTKVSMIICEENLE